MPRSKPSTGCFNPTGAPFVAITCSDFDGNYQSKNPRKHQVAQAVSPAAQ